MYPDTATLMKAAGKLKNDCWESWKTAAALVPPLDSYRSRLGLASRVCVGPRWVVLAVPRYTKDKKARRKDEQSAKADGGRNWPLEQWRTPKQRENST